MTAIDRSKSYEERFRAICFLNGQTSNGMRWRAIGYEGSTLVMMEACYRVALLLKRKFGKTFAGRDLFMFLSWQNRIGVTSQTVMPSVVMHAVQDDLIFPLG